MARILDYIRILRPTNLAIIILSQYFIQYHVIDLLVEGELLMTPFIWSLFVLTTCIIAATGYIINDVYDVEIDTVNKPEKTFIPQKITVAQALRYYWAWVLVGFAISVYIANTIDFISHLWLYPLCVAVLYFYASHIKSSVLWGNIIVSLFVAWVWGILFYVEATQHGEIHILYYIGIVFSIIGFFINLMREIIKDIEDKDGDSLQNIKTLPIVYGIQTSKIIVYMLGVVTLFIIIYSLIAINGSNELNMFGVLLLCLLVMTLMKIFTSEKKSDYSRVSRFLKIIMMMGILGIYLVAKSFS